MSEETHRKTSGGSTSRSSLKTQRKGENLREEIIPKIVGNQEESQRGRGLNLEDEEIIIIVVNQGIRRKIVGLKIIMKEIK